MIAYSDSNVVFVADTLERLFRAVYRGLASIFTELATSPRTNSVTLYVRSRDYLSVQMAEGRFVHVRYEPDYRSGKHRHVRADGEIGPTLSWLREY